MADFDAQQAHAHAQAHQNRQDHDQARMDHIERTISRMGDALNNLQQAPPPVPPPPPARIHYNLNLTPPPPIAGGLNGPAMSVCTSSKGVWCNGAR